MQPNLAKIRRKLTVRYGLITGLILLIFGAGTYLQVLQARRQLIKQQLQQLAGTATSQMPLILHETEERRYQSRGNFAAAIPTQLETIPNAANNTSSTLGSKQIIWLNSKRQIISQHGSFKPIRENYKDGALNRTKFIELNNGIGLWKPVWLNNKNSNRAYLAGYVSVALSYENADAEIQRLRRGLLVGGISALAAAVFLSQWMVATSLRPIRDQIKRLLQFTADASHELRHPLTAIRALIGSLDHELKGSRNNSEIARKLSRIDQSTQQMSSLVDDLLLLARLDRAIPEEQRWQRFDLSELVEDLAELHRELATQSGVTLILECDGPVHVHGNPERLRQLLNNLLSNGLRFSPMNGKLRVGCRSQGRQIELWVEDEGPGIPSPQRALVFERFWRADASRTGVHTGLGLAIAQGICHEHGGALQALEGSTGGCRMELHLPSA